MSTTLGNLKTAARQRADMVNNNFVTDAELVTYINSSIAELHDLLVSCYGADYFTTSTTTATVSGTADYALPADFYKLKGVDIKMSDQFYTVKPFNWNERNRNTDLSWGLISGPSIRYRLVGSNLKLVPTPSSAHVMKIWYIPKATALVSDGDVFDDINQFSEYVITDAAIKMLQKEESDVSVLFAQKQALTARIQAMANNRDAEKPDSISDIHAENDDYWIYRSWS